MDAFANHPPVIFHTTFRSIPCQVAFDPHRKITRVSKSFVNKLRSVGAITGFPRFVHFVLELNCGDLGVSARVLLCSHGAPYISVGSLDMARESIDFFSLATLSIPPYMPDYYSDAEDAHESAIFICF